MASGDYGDLLRGGFVGSLKEKLGQVLTNERLSAFSEELVGDDVKVLAEGRHRVVVIPLSIDGVEELVAVKVFGKQDRWKDRYDFKRGSKAARSYQAARFLKEHEVGTPEPLGYFERWEGKRLQESYYLSSYVGGLTSVRDFLFGMYEESGDCARLVRFLGHLGGAMRRMHDAGFCHRDLGNQNMELQGAIDGDWGEVQFIDLNRGKIREELSLQERAMDFSRLRLPSSFLSVLVKLYWNNEQTPEFFREMNKLRRRFDFWENSRRFRHPFQHHQARKKGKGIQDIWIWDRESGQASITMERAERKKHYPKGHHVEVIRPVLQALVPVMRAYQDVAPMAFGQRVEMRGRIGMSLEGADLDFEKQRTFLDKLGKLPVLLRFCHHEGRAQWEKTLGYADELHAAGHELMVALVQDRRAIWQPEEWKSFLEFVIERLAGKVKYVELCHSVNRSKWGVHSAEEQRELLRPAVDLQKRYPNIGFTGPSCIDFEFHYVVSSLSKTPPGLNYAALSHQLYVDRRGAPENKQGKYGLVEKCALLRAISQTSKATAGGVIVSEVNWPLEGTGIWSPVTATYWVEGSSELPVSVSEERYGWFLLRYVTLALCSGFVDQVYWWRLVAHGYGLVDERAEGGWRARAGFRMLQFYLELLGSATFVEKIELESEVYALRFERAEDEVLMLWCNGRTYSGPWPLKVQRALDVYGKEMVLESVGESPVYVIN